MAARRTWTDAQLIEAVHQSVTVKEVGTRLGLARSNNYAHLWRHVKRLQLSVAHFLGSGWARGKSFSEVRAKPLQYVLCDNSAYDSDFLRRRLIRKGLKKAQCELCRIIKWRGKPAPLQLDHINGNPTDNRLINLRILCANCHAQTPTWGRKKRVPLIGVQSSVRFSSVVVAQR